MYIEHSDDNFEEGAVEISVMYSILTWNDGNKFKGLRKFYDEEVALREYDSEVSAKIFDHIVFSEIQTHTIVKKRNR